jgi:hypothetical protein
MALALTHSPANPKHGEVFTLTYGVTGEPAPVTVNSTGSAHIDGLDLTTSDTMTIGNSERFDPPIVPGVTMSPTADPRVWTGIAP